MGAAEQRAIIGAYTQTTTVLRSQLLTLILALFRGLGSWRDTDQARFLQQALPQVAGGQRQMVGLTDAYLSQLAADLDGTAPEPLGIQARDGAELRNGTEPEEVYTRPFRTVYQELGEGSDMAQALDRALNRLYSNCVTDLQLAKTHASADWLEEGTWLGRDESRYYRRVLTGTSSCGLCVVASTQRYRKPRLLPIHPGCDCAVGLIESDTDPGQVINETLLDNAHEAIEKTFGVSDRGARNPIDYRDVLIEHQHGEYGPVLARARDAFTGPRDLDRRVDT